jgi:hypothetical protein
MIGVPTGLPVDPTDDHLARTTRTPILLPTCLYSPQDSSFKLQVSIIFSIWLTADLLYAFALLRFSLYFYLCFFDLVLLKM